ncbi:Epididymal secretory protein E1 [Orchesella cincta]|uniref:Epididymal secretory protein E1 n=1 Tax=Orchesella cincta TaxID=48709 RepID=A0A1D2NFP5_ORCCI|nr:Epididymal secretory protein E1 [Orchesella cincta]
MSFQPPAAICLFVLIIASVLGEFGTPIKVRNCPGESPKASLAAVYIENCSQEPCIFRKGQNVTMEMDLEFCKLTIIIIPTLLTQLYINFEKDHFNFKAEGVQSLRAKLYALVLGVPVLWDGINPEACQDIISEGPRCPLSAGDYITYGVNLYVNPIYPTVTADVKYMLLDENKRTQICWIVKASVK